MKRVTRSAILSEGCDIGEPVPLQDSFKRRILKAKRSHLSSSTAEDCSTLNIQIQEVNLSKLSSSFKCGKTNTDKNVLLDEKKRKRSTTNKLNIDHHSSKQERKLRSAKVDVAQDDDNLSTETSSADDVKKARKGETTNQIKAKKKYSHKKIKISSTTECSDVINAISEETVNYTSSNDENNILKFNNATNICESEDLLQKNTNKHHKIKSKRKKRQDEKCKLSEQENYQLIAEDVLCAKENDSKIKKSKHVKRSQKKKENRDEHSDKENDRPPETSAAKVTSRRRTYELEEPSALLLNSPLNTKITLDVSGVTNITNNGISYEIASNECVSPKVSLRNRKSSIMAQKMEQPSVEFRFSSTESNEHKIAEKQSPLTEKELRRSTYEIKANAISSPSTPKAAKVRTLSATSTPKSTKKVTLSLLKQTFVNNNNNRNVSFNNLPQVSTKKTVSNESAVVKSNKSRTPAKSKMPNFALIHQKAEKQLENIEEFRNRQADRAKELLSGHKSTSKKNQLRKSLSADQVLTETKTKKQLNYSLKLNASFKAKTVQSTVMHRSVAAAPHAVTATKLNKKPESKIPIKNAVAHETVSTKKPVTHNRFGFKLGKDAQERKDLIKAFANKTKCPKEQMQEKREILKGVRSNRRFDLLMQMRNKN